MAKMSEQEGSRAVLIEVINVLGGVRDKFVVVGGWVPDLLYPEKGHIGSLDVDLAVQRDAFWASPYETILRRLINAEYRQKNTGACFTRDVVGLSEPITVDLISGQCVTGDNTVSVQVGELNVSSLRGIDLAFEFCDELEITGAMPDGSQNTVRAQVVCAEAFILIKAFALDERKKAKDAFDVYFVLRHYQPSITSLADKLTEMLDNDLAAESFGILRQKFASLESVGPVWAAQVARDEQGEEYDQVRQSAFQYAQSLFDAIDTIRRTESE